MYIVTPITKLYYFIFYFVPELVKGIDMIYKLTLKRSRDVKTLIEAETKKNAICYFASLLHLTQEDLLKIFLIREA